jgi:hypothetical protein
MSDRHSRQHLLGSLLSDGVSYADSKPIQVVNCRDITDKVPAAAGVLEQLDSSI